MIEKSYRAENPTLPDTFTAGMASDHCPICQTPEGEGFWGRMFHAMTRLWCSHCGLDEWVWND